MIDFLIKNAFQIAKDRGWDKVYWAIDIHETILKSNYTPGNISRKFIGNSKEVLQKLSKREDSVLILYTCSYPEEIEQYLEFFKENGILFDYVNENPECPSTGYGDFSKKFYYNILLDDKAGFYAENDWDSIDLALSSIKN